MIILIKTDIKTCCAVDPFLNPGIGTLSRVEPFIARVLDDDDPIVQTWRSTEERDNIAECHPEAYTLEMLGIELGPRENR